MPATKPFIVIKYYEDQPPLKLGEAGFVEGAIDLAYADIDPHIIFEFELVNNGGIVLRHPHRNHFYLIESENETL